jgi:hypothetical protein
MGVALAGVTTTQTIILLVEVGVLAGCALLTFLGFHR